MADRPSRQQLTLAVRNRNLQTLLNDNQTFRQFLWTLFVDAGIFYPTYSRGSPHDTSYKEGRRSLGLEVLHRLKNLQPGVLGLIEREGDLLVKAEKEAAPTPSQEDPDEDEFLTEPDE